MSFLHVLQSHLLPCLCLCAENFNSAHFQLCCPTARADSAGDAFRVLNLLLVACRADDRNFKQQCELSAGQVPHYARPHHIPSRPVLICSNAWSAPDFFWCAGKVTFRAFRTGWCTAKLSCQLKKNTKYKAKRRLGRTWRNITSQQLVAKPRSRASCLVRMRSARLALKGSILPSELQGSSCCRSKHLLAIGASNF